jgi:hypothetical protein
LSCKQTRAFRLAVLPTANGIDLADSFSSEQITGEIQRIKLYQKKGDVASLKEYLQFLQ